MSNWKFYDLEVKPYQPFIFYVVGNKVTLTSDPDNPYPPTNSIWNAEQKKYDRIGDFPPNKMITPTIQVKKKDLDEYIKNEVVVPLMERYGKDDLFKSANVIILKKDLGECVELGSALRVEGITDTPNEMAQNHYDQLMKLKAFW